jgi:hypothetical protein
MDDVESPDWKKGLFPSARDFIHLSGFQESFYLEEEQSLDAGRSYER